MEISLSQILGEVEYYLYYKHYDKLNLDFETKETKTQIKVIAYDCETGAIIETISLKKKELLNDPLGIFEKFRALKEEAIQGLNSA